MERDWLSKLSNIDRSFLKKVSLLSWRGKNLIFKKLVMVNHNQDLVMFDYINDVFTDCENYDAIRNNG